MGGTLDVESDGRGGTCFTVTLPFEGQGSEVGG
jgi:signal transduction histidine kinase